MDLPRSEAMSATKKRALSPPITPKETKETMETSSGTSDSVSHPVVIGVIRKSSRKRSSPKDDTTSASTNNSGEQNGSKPATVTPRVPLRRSPTNGSDKQSQTGEDEHEEAGLTKSGATRQSTRNRTQRQAYNEEPPHFAPKVG